MAILNRNQRTTLGDIRQIQNDSKRTFTDQEIDRYSLEQAINENALAKRPVNIRSKLAYKELLKNTQPTSKYLLPGQFAIFNYLEPKFKDTLEYYDKTPFVLFLGITRTEGGQIRELGLNLHYYPPHARSMIMESVYNTFRPHWERNFNNVEHRPNVVLDWKTVKGLIGNNAHIAFGVKQYIPFLRDNTRVIPARLLSTAFFTEGNFSKSTMQQIFRFWRQYR